MFIIAIALVLAGLAVFGFGKLVDNSAARSNRTIINRPPFGAIGAGLTVLGLVAGAASLVYVVSTQQVGIPVTFGKPGAAVGNGIHAKAPWTKVATMDGTVQIDDNLGERRTEIRLGNQSVAFVQNSVRWRIKTDAADRLYRDHKTFERIEPALVEQELATALNDAFKDFDPLQQATGDAKSLDEVSAIVKARLDKRIGDRITIESVTIPKVDFDDKTQQRIDAYQQEIGNTRIAEQRKKTASADAEANKVLAASVSKDPNVLVSKCLDQLSEMVNKGQQIPVGFSCWPAGSTTGGVIVDATKAPETKK